MSAMYQTFQNTPIFQTAWRGFLGSKWTDEVNVRDFIQNNYTQYDGDESFLAAPTSATHLLWERLQKLQKEEHEKGGVLECETEIVSSLTAYGPGYIDPELKDLERIVGLQTDKPLKRAFMPFGGIKMAEEAAETYGYHVNSKFHKIFTEYHKTHNQAVFDAYTPEMKTARHCHIVTGLPDTYGRGRIVGDYRRIALYGIDFLIQEKKKDLERCGNGAMFDDIIRQREEIAEQIRALKGIQEMAAIYGFDISRPASNAKEAVQWLYFGYLAAVKTQNGAAMSVGRVSTFLDIYINRDLTEQTLTEAEAQELIDHMTMKFRMVKFARIPSYNQLFSGDPVWATLEVAGLGQDGRPMVTKNDFRFLHTLENMGPSPEPNLTPEKLIPLMISRALADEELPVYGDGANVRDWLHVSDHCEAIDLILHKGRVGEIYNIGGHNERTNLEVVKTILKALDKPESLIRYVKDRPGHDRRYAIDPTKIETELGWKPKYNFDTGIRQTIDWYLNNQDWWKHILSGEYSQYFEKMYGDRL